MKKDAVIKWSVCPNYVGKPEGMWLTSHDWLNVETSVFDFFELVATDGRSFCSQLIDGHRTDENFLCMSVAAVDIDHGMTLQQLEQHPFYQEFGGGYYTTPSHTDTDNRFRILFFLKEPITSGQYMRFLYMALINEFKSDPSCKNPTRLFFGTPDCKHVVHNTDVFLPSFIADELVREVEEANKVYYSPQPSTQNKPIGGMPKWLPDFVREHGDAEVEGRDSIINRFAWSLKGRGYDRQTATELILAYNSSRCIPSLSHADVMDKINRAYRGS